MSKLATAVMYAGVTGAVGAAAFTAASAQPAADAQPHKLYELRTYTTHTGRLPALNARFKNHTMKLFEKHGMKNIMYWIPTDPKLKDNTLIYILSHASEEAAKKSWDAFLNDPEWKAARDASERDGPIVAKAERVYMTLADYSPGAK